MEKTEKQTMTEKVLWAIFNLLESADDLISPPRLYLTSHGGWFEYNEIIRKMSWQKDRTKFAKLINNLKRHGYLKTKIGKDKKAVMLTFKGCERILKFALEKSDKKKRHDGKWQMVIWDIPEKYKKTRHRFRLALKLLGYRQLQKSVWVCPYDVLKEAEKIIRFYRLEPYVRIFLISEIKE